MAIFPWQKTKEIDRFANWLADEFFSRIQPELADEHFKSKNKNIENKKELKSMQNNAQKVNQAISQTIAEFRKFRESQSLGVYGKARFHMKFRDRLAELGYEKDIAKKLDEEILFKTA